MSKIFITGSSDGIGLETARQLVSLGHEVVFHAKDKQRAMQIKAYFKIDVKILIADLNNLDETKILADELNLLGGFDTIIHNAGVLNEDKKTIFKVNVLAPFVLTALISKPKQVLYIGSNMHPQGDIDLEMLKIDQAVDYSTSKLMILMLGLAASRVLKDTRFNIVDPGWVKTKMANYNAPDSLEDGSKTQVWLASNEELTFNGKYFYHLQETKYSSKADDINLQDNLIKFYEEISGVDLIN
ncbi:SDR family NAD(P)-dependent oxidoreductase [Arcobacter arenosus]|uniref:SDR family NAD(P)-dependent oxidoreductase n=1 Tax=Arcobacter arenosus TaxID=2576037 RepID=A0A5R8Y2A4_9BACT|nr:SDR family NAD(P)-dependent oxidoreductase [Arcobacter arenosus]TLP39393.1 SDR family NAD(P)-dependent oxidoreductase [Arcobacter arenosus]